MPTSPDNSPRSADDLIREGLTASQQGQPDAALSLFRQAAHAAPASGVPHFLIAAELAQLGHMDEAEGSYASAVLLAPQLDMARYQLGLIQFTSGRAALALVTWSPLLQGAEHSALKQIVQGFAALAQDDFVQAVAQFREGMRLNRDNPALNKDLQLMIDRVGAQTATGADPKAAATAEPEAPAEDLHVLLSNYQQHGPLH